MLFYLDGGDGAPGGGGGNLGCAWFLAAQPVASIAQIAASAAILTIFFITIDLIPLLSNIPPILFDSLCFTESPPGSLITIS